MATEILMPQMGESIAEGTITRWLVAVGDRVERDQPVLEISTDKVDAEIPSPATGTISAIYRQAGEVVPVNQVVGLIAAPGEAALTVPAAVAAVVAEPDIEVELEEEAEPAAEGEMTLEERVRRFSSPLVRSIAAKEGVDLRFVKGTGIHGRVTKKDIFEYLETRTAAPAAAETAVAPVAAPASAPPPAAQVPAVVVAAPAAAPSPSTPTPAPSPSAPAPAPAPAGTFHIPAYLPGENVVIEPMSRIRQITANHMVYSKTTAAHVSTVFHVDMSKVARIRERARDRFAKENGTKLTYMPFIFRAVCNGLRRYPQINAAIDGTNIVYKKDINLGMAVALAHGLIVPVMKKADEKSLVGLARAANNLADRARNKQLKPEEVQGGTFTITNPGVFGSLFGTPIINQPQVAILGIGTVEKRAIVLTDADGNDAIAIRTMAYLTITFDHRLIDGADADHFMNVVKSTLEGDEWGELAPYL